MSSWFQYLLHVFSFRVFMSLSIFSIFPNSGNPISNRKPYAVRHPRWAALSQTRCAVNVKCLAPGGKNATILLAQNFQLWTCWFCIMGPPNKKWEECFAPFSPVTIPFYVIMTSLSSLKPSLDSVDSSSCWKDEYYFSRFFTRRNFQHVLIWPKGFWASPPQH